MKYLQKLPIILLVPIIIFGLVGCSSANSTALNSENKEVVKANPQEVKSIKEDLTAKIDNLVNTNNEIIKKVGWLTSEQYGAYQKEINLIAEAAGSSAKFTINDTKDMNDNIKKLTSDIQSLSDSQALSAKDRIHSVEIIYKIVFMETFHTLFEFVDLNGDFNQLNTFTTHPLSTLKLKYYNNLIL